LNIQKSHCFSTEKKKFVKTLDPRRNRKNTMCDLSGDQLQESGVSNVNLFDLKDIIFKDGFQLFINCFYKSGGGC
jgi:hypothetical protein